ncbi:MAG: TRAM domain-containing protein, partial [Actinomycetota bacterium]|nr:TRAM domain-containing protein [Actinomycetota bacterium]
MGYVHLEAHGVAAGGDALARDDDGRVVFVEGALPGETVTAEVFESKRDYARARVVEVLSPSPGRVAAPCAGVAAGCGGCQWQHVDYPAQLRIKQTVVAYQLRRVGGFPDAENLVRPT